MFRHACIATLLLVAPSAPVPAADEPLAGADDHAFERTGRIESSDLDEASGLEASRARPGHWFALNDSDRAAVLYVLTTDGADVAVVEVEGAINRDWEALASIPSTDSRDRRALVIGDIGDNAGRRDTVTLYVVDEPRPDAAGRYPGTVPVTHAVELVYPDGPRDAEALAWDPLDDRLVLVTKRDRPARVYAMGRTRALQAERATLEFVGTLHPLRPPDEEDARRFGRQAPWVSQPTGMDISADGTQIAVITYRSLYRFRRDGTQELAAALAASPVEHVGPPGATEEAVAFTPGDGTVLIAAEGRGAMLYRSPGLGGAVGTEPVEGRRPPEP